MADERGVAVMFVGMDVLWQTGGRANLALGAVSTDRVRIDAVDAVEAYCCPSSRRVASRRVAPRRAAP